MDKGYKVTEHDIKQRRTKKKLLNESEGKSKAEAFFVIFFFIYIFCYPRISTHLLIQWGGKRIM